MATRLILIVEDCEDAVPALQIALESACQCTVAHVYDGRDALEELDRASDPVAAIVTDLHLPGMDGWALIRAMRSDNRWAEIPILVISADTDPRTPARARDLGANAFFAKPYSPAEVSRSLKEILDAHSNLGFIVSQPPSALGPAAS